jgi:hypothetical protein
MKKVKLHLLLLAFLAIGAAWITKPRKMPPSVHNYSFLSRSMDGTRLYYGKDLTSLAYVKGIDYICLTATYTCTFYADPTRSHSDLTGSYFYVWDIASGGYDNSGVYYDF